MADFDDNDFDIDELLDEIDSSGTKGKEPTGDTAGTGGAAGSGSSSLEKKNVINVSSSKSVRFSDEKGSSSGDGKDDDFLSKLPRSQSHKGPTSLGTLFFPTSSDKSSSSTSNASGKPPLPTTLSTGRSSRSSALGSSASREVKDDWLGIQDGKGSLSPSGSPPPSLPSQRRIGTGPVIPEPAKAPSITGNSSEEEDALFNDIGLTRPTSGRRTASAPTAKSGIADQPPIKSGGPAQQMQKASRFGLDSNPATPPMSLGNQDMPALPPKSSFSSSYLDQLGMSPPPPPSSGDSKPAPSLLPKHNPLPSTASLLGTMPSSSGGAASSMFPPQDFPPPIPPKIPSGDVFQSFSLAAPPTPSPSQQQGGGVGPTGKKKIVKKDIGPIANSILTNSSTLQLPSHLINEEELKLMSSSLKTLYANQLEMLEKSYREQMVFLSEANRRKEDLLKEEMKGMQTDYEERLDRLKAEVRELELQKSQKEPTAHFDASALATLAEQLNASIVTVRDVLQKSQDLGAISSAGGFSDGALAQALEKQVGNMFLEYFERNKEHQESTDDKLLGMIKSMDDSVGKRFNLMNDAWRNLLNQVKQNMKELMEASASNANRHIHAGLEEEVKKSEKKVLGQLDTLGKIIKGKEDLSPKLVSKFEESEKLLLGEFAKLHKLQRKTKESADGITLEPLVKLLESDREEEQRRRERLALHLKEMRRDLKRILLENEGRQESTQKFSLSTEMELKSISQSIRDLNSQLKFSLISGPSHPENLTNQFNSSMQQTQAEMEMKLLREERHALSDSMSQINVEKRKLSEDKVGLEKQKLDFQKERDQLRNLELQLKTKLDETEELQKKTDSVRREEIHLTSEAQMKMRELDKEKSSLRDKLMEVEQRLRLWEQKLRQERVEVMRERELVERMRDQLLCPGCLKPNEHVGVIMHPPPPPYIPLDTGSSHSQIISNVANEYFNSRLNTSSGGGGDGTSTDDLFDNYYRKLFE